MASYNNLCCVIRRLPGTATASYMRARPIVHRTGYQHSAVWLFTFRFVSRVFIKIIWNDILLNQAFYFMHIKVLQ